MRIQLVWDSNPDQLSYTSPITVTETSEELFLFLTTSYNAEILGVEIGVSRKKHDGRSTNAFAR